ncbi:MAG: FAD-dependent oxidoreductase [Nanoarchaeota archaeon]|nr:FAD-dependent oxidoreductase [Nanoarchaeota archaeon]
MKKYDFVVLGAGIAGLAFAKKISEKGSSILMLEKEKQIGGLSRTIKHNGFYLDFCAHRFHTKNEELLKEITSLPNLKLYKHTKRSRIYMFNKYLKYPFEIQNLLAAMPPHKSVLSGTSFLMNSIKKKFKKPRIISYKDWFVYFYGKQLYNVMCYPYTSKIWHMDPGKISVDWADQRFPKEGLRRLIKKIIKKIITLDFSSYKLEDDELAPDGGMFYYPLRGIQELSDSLARVSIKNRAEILCSTEITGISTKDKIIYYTLNKKKYSAKYDKLISTIPLHDFYKLQDRKDPKVESSLKKLGYMDIIFVYLFLDRKNVSKDSWLYFPDKNIIFNRAVEFSNWSPKMCPEGKTSICFDITTYEGDKIWNMSDDKLSEKTISDAKRINYIDKKDKVSSYVFRLKNAYPVYDLDYKKKLNAIVKFLESDSLFLLGRTGIFRYNNLDNSVEMGFKLAENFIEGKDPKSIYEY